MIRSVIVFMILFITNMVSLAQGKTAVGQDEPVPEFHIDTALVVRMRYVATAVGPAMIHFADSIAMLHGGKVTPINYKSFQSTIRKCNQEKVQADEINDLFGQSMLNICVELKKRYYLSEQAKYYADRVHHLRDVLIEKEGLFPMEGAVDIVCRLHESGIPVAVALSYTSAML